MIDIIDGVINDVLSQVFENIENYENPPFENELLKIPPQFRSKDPNSLRIYINNIRGFSGKKEVTEKIINNTNSDIVIITETHFSNANVPKLSNFRSFN